MSKEALSVKQNMAWNTVGSLVYLVCQWVITVLVVRLSNGYDAAGVLALGMAVSNIFTPLGYFKVRSYQVSDLNEEYSFGQYLGFRVLTVAISLTCMIVYAVTTCSSDALLPVALYCIYSCGPVFADVLHGAAQQKGRLDVAGKDMALRGIASVVAFTVIMSMTNSLSIALAAMSIVTFPFVLIGLPRMLRGIVAKQMPSFSLKAMKSLFLSCLPAAIGLVLAGAIPSIPRQMLGDMYGAEALGAYASVAAPVVVVQMGANYIYAPLISVFAKHYLSKNQKAFLVLFGKVSLAIIFLSIVALIGFSIAGEWVLAFLYGAGIRQYIYLLLPLVFCTVLTAFFWFLGDLLVVVRDMKGNLWCYSCAFVVCIACSYPLLAACGLNGASYAVIAGLIFGSAMCMMRVYRAIRRECE